MTPVESVVAALERNWDMVDSALSGLDETIIAQRPNDHCNSIAWTLWHMNRVVDNFVHTRFQEKPQLWVSDGWAQKYGMAANPDDRGVGWTAEQVAAWKAPSREVQLGYYEAIKTSARKYLESLTEADLERRMVAPPVQEPRSIAALLGQMTWDNVAHGGQIAYLRGFYRGMGWHR